MTPKKTHAPQPARPAHESEASPNLHSPADAVLTGKPTLHGQAPTGLERHFRPATPGKVAEFGKLPSPGERCPFTGASRSWLVDQAEAGNIKLVRVRRPGRLRGAVFVHIPTLLAFLRSEMEKSNTPVAPEEGTV